MRSFDLRGKPRAIQHLQVMLYDKSHLKGHVRSTIATVALYRRISHYPGTALGALGPGLLMLAMVFA